MKIGIDLCSLSTNTKKFCTDNLTDVGTQFMRINRKWKNNLTEMNCIPRRVDLSTILTYKIQGWRKDGAIALVHFENFYKIEPKE